MRKMLIFITGLAAVVLFSGCAPKNISADAARTYLLGQNKFIVIIRTNSDFSKNEWAFHLQEVSEYGLKHGYRYFAIMLPNRISNTKGSSFNSFEEINRFCSDNSFDCGERIYVKYYIFWEVEYFKKQPIKYVTFDAKAVIRDLKQKGLYLSKVPEGWNDLIFKNRVSYERLRSIAEF